MPIKVPNGVMLNAYPDSIGRCLSDIVDMLKRPEIGIDDLTPLLEDGADYAEREREQVEINAKYAGYLSRQQDEINKAQRHETTELPLDLDYAQVRGLSKEAREQGEVAGEPLLALLRDLGNEQLVPMARALWRLPSSWLWVRKSTS